MQATKGHLLRPLALIVAALVASAALAAFVLASPARAADPRVIEVDGDTITVKFASGPLLREAINLASERPGPNKIVFDFRGQGVSVIDTFGLTFEITDQDGLTIDGGNERVAIRGTTQRGSIFEVARGAKLSLDSLTVEKGVGGFGGGIHNLGGGALTVSNSAITDNQAVVGGGIYNEGKTTLINSTIEGNLSRPDPQRNAGIGDGIFNAQGGTLSVVNSTIADNGRRSGSNLHNQSNGPDVELKNTIVASKGGVGTCSGFVTDGGYNLDSDRGCSFDQPTSRSNVDWDSIFAGRQLRWDGGSTPTLPLETGNGRDRQKSPAIDAGNNAFASGLEFDQRGPGFARIVGGTVDIGAYEVQPPRPQGRR